MRFHLNRKGKRRNAKAARTKTAWVWSGRGGGGGGSPLEIVGDLVLEAGGRVDLPLRELLLQPVARDLAQHLHEHTYTHTNSSERERKKKTPKTNYGESGRRGDGIGRG